MNRPLFVTGAATLALAAFAAPAQAGMITPHTSVPQVITPQVAPPSATEPGIGTPAAPNAPASSQPAPQIQSGSTLNADEPRPNPLPEPGPEPKKSIFSPVVEPFEKLATALFCLASQASYNRSFDVLRGSIRAYAGLSQTFDSNPEEEISDEPKVISDFFSTFHATQQGFIRSCFSTRTP